MSKFGLDETEVTRIVGKELQSLKTAVQENKDNITNMNNKSGWDRALQSSLRRLDVKLQTLQAEIAVIQERLKNIAQLEAGINKG